MKKINISVVGALGRMGKILIKIINTKKNLKLYSLTDASTGKSINNIKIQSNSLKAFINTDVIIDFSSPEGSLQVIALAVKLKKNVIVGTTGFTENQNQIILKVDKKYFRPSEVKNLKGDSSKAEKKLNWKIKSNIKDLAKDMMNHDYNYYKKIFFN